MLTRRRSDIEIHTQKKKTRAILYDDRSDDETDIIFTMNDANMDESIYMDVDESIHTACESDRNLEHLA